MNDYKGGGQVKISNKRSFNRIRFHSKKESSSKKQGYTALSKHRLQRKNASSSVDSHQLSPLHPNYRGSANLIQNQGGDNIPWRFGKTQTTYIRSQLPQITQFKAARNFATSYPRPPRTAISLKIPFKELIPIKQISRQQKLKNLQSIREQFISLVNLSNRVSVDNKNSVFRAYVERGNHGVLVKELLKKRWWWHLEENVGKANLVWTQWFNITCTAALDEENSKESQCAGQKQQIPLDQPKLTSIRKLIDHQTYTIIQPRISLSDEHYLNLNAKNKTLFLQNIQEVSTAGNTIIHNHIDGCLQLHSKKLLFNNIYTQMTKKGLDPFQIMPITYYIGQEDSPSLRQLYSHCMQLENEGQSQNMWIVKPGENSNRGFGITVHAGLQSLKTQIQTRQFDGKSSLIVQKYIENCFLIQNRKCDIRTYLLITTVNGYLKAYWYPDGYLRTASSQYSLANPQNLMVHLTNDAVQKNSQSYGKFQDFNKISYASFKKYLTKLGHPANTFERVHEQMKNIAYQLVSCTAHKILRKQYTFQVIKLFGLDFMLDQQLKPYLIEANSNPCLDNSGIILGRLIYELIDNLLMVAVDPLFPPPIKNKAKEYLSRDYFSSNKFQLIYSNPK